MTNFFTLIIALIGTSINTYCQTVKYFFIPATSTTEILYSMGTATFKDYYLSETVVINNKNYSVRVRDYSWGEKDTAYFRLGADGFYSCSKSGFETMEIPNNPINGRKWIAADSSWCFEIINIKATLVTPEKRYYNLIEVVASKVTSGNDRQYDQYHNFYASEIGYVGSMVNGKLLNYLKTIHQ